MKPKPGNLCDISPQKLNFKHPLGDEDLDGQNSGSYWWTGSCERLAHRKCVRVCVTVACSKHMWPLWMCVCVCVYECAHTALLHLASRRHYILYCTYTRCPCCCVNQQTVVKRSVDLTVTGLHTSAVTGAPLCIICPIHQGLNTYCEEAEGKPGVCVCVCVCVNVSDVSGKLQDGGGLIKRREQRARDTLLDTQLFSWVK